MKRTSITLADPVYAAGLEIATKRGFATSFSAYVAWLVNRDAAGAVTREDTPVLSKAKSPAKGTRTTKHPTKRGK